MPDVPDDFELDADFELSTDFDISSEPDPLADVPLTGDLEKDSEAEVSAMLAAFKARNQREKDSKVDILDSEYWCCLCFQTRDQKEAFLKALKLLDHGDKYLDGRLVAKKLNIELPDERVQFHEREEKTSYTGVIPVIRRVTGDRKKGR